MSKELFRVLRDMHGDEFESFISDKLCPVAGDIAMEDLGIQETHLKEEIMEEVDIIANVAATTTFDERYDIALDINALGADRAMAFARRCHKLQMFLHVSTAYVCGSKSGSMLEKPIQMGETPNGPSNLDIEEELRLVEKELKQLRERGVEKGEETAAMKELGLKRARSFGWPNSYAFTKAMGEMLIGESRGDLPLVIIRPTIIEATLADPFPGWIEGFRTAGSIIMSYGKGRLKCFPGNANLPLDVIPADMVVNSMLVSMVAHSRQSASFIYHVGSSKQNPLRTSIIADCAYRYFSKSPVKGRDGKAIAVPKAYLYTSMDDFRKYMNFHYNMPLQGLRLANFALFNIYGRLHADLSRKYNFIMYLAQLYEPYVFFDGSFDDSSAEGLRMAVKAAGTDEGLFNFDPKCINWEDYCMNVYFPGLVRYVMQQK
ncbi:unnamed protein product [Victoria cruziana]